MKNLHLLIVIEENVVLLAQFDKLRNDISRRNIGMAI
jgi:hypothetical protein